MDVAVIAVDHAGAGTLHLGDELVEHVIAAQPRLVARVLLDYAATVGRDLTVVTWHTDGRSTVHRIRANGTAALLHPSPALPQPTNTHRPELRCQAVPRRLQVIRAAASRIHSVVTGGWAMSRQWLVGHGLWLMLCVQILLLVGSLAFIGVALSPYLWPPP
jgi:hypothetical protein